MNKSISYLSDQGKAYIFPSLNIIVHKKKLINKAVSQSSCEDDMR